MKYSSNSILAFTPQNKESELILNQALLFQEALGKRIFITDIVKPASIFPQIFQTEKVKNRHKEAVDKLHHFVRGIIQKEIPKEVLLRIRYGNAVTTLIKESKKGGYEFIIVDKSGGNFKSALSQSEINKFVSKSHCPVLTINKDFPIKSINTIIVPIDISQTTKKRLYWATLFAKKFNAKIQIVSALNVNIDKTKSLAFKNAEKIKKMLLERGIECDVEILKAHNQARHTVLLDYIEKKNPELVIIRTHQEYHFSGKRIGKFVSEIIHGCNAPVFIVGGSTENLPVDFK
ncbi:MAG: universal stress protein [Bacteroidetes bacterium]|nr:universal stress protein [Bacteroidota bacterium]